MKSIIGKKVGMTSVYDDKGKYVACTVVQAGPCVVTQVKTTDNDGYSALQLAFDDKKEKSTTNAMKGHFAKAKTTPKRKLVEIRDCDFQKNIGEVVTCDIFADGEKIKVSGVSKGKGFQGVVKRHGFSGVGSATHGQHDRMRAPGSLGGSSHPARVFKGIRMAGRMGGDNVSIKNIRIVKIMKENNLILLQGAVPGAKGSYLILQK